MATFYKDDEQAGEEVRREGQRGLSVPTQYQPGQIYSALRGRKYEPGQEAAEYVGRQAIKPPGVQAATPAEQPGSDEELLSYLAGRKAQAVQTTESGGESDEDLLQYLASRKTPSTEPAAPAPQPDSDGTLLGDLGRSLVRGGIALGGGVYELANIGTGGGLDSATQSAFGKSGTQAITGARESLNKSDSPELQAQRAELEKAEGFWSSFGTVLTNPRLLGSMALEMVPQMATVAGAAKTVATRAFTTELAKQTAANVSKAEAIAAANQAAGRAATFTVMGVNPALEAGMAGSDVRAEVMAMSEADLQTSPQYQNLIKQFGDNDQGRALARARLANDAATTAALVTAPISAASSLLFKGGVEGDIARSAAAKAAGVTTGRTVGQVAKGIVTGGAREATQEGIEEGGSQFGQNVGAISSGADPNRSPLKGVPEAAGAGAALGFAAGAGGNVRLPQSEAAPASPGQPGGTQGTPAPGEPAGSPQNTGTDTPSEATDVRLSDEEFGRTMESPKIVPVMAALYYEAGNQPQFDAEGNQVQLPAGQLTMQQTQIRELLRQYNPTVDLTEIVDQNPDIVAQGNAAIEAAPAGFIQAFRNSIPEQVAKPSQTSVAPPAMTDEELTDQQAALDIDEDTADAAIASAEALGIKPREPANAATQAAAGVQGGTPNVPPVPPADTGSQAGTNQGAPDVSDKLYSKTPGGKIKAVMFKDLKKVFFSKSASRIGSGPDTVTPQQFRALELHEIGAHYAAEQMLGAEGYQKLLSDLEAMRGKDKRVDEAYGSVPQDTLPALVNEEALGYLVENYENMNIVQRFFQMVRDWYAKTFNGQQLTATEIRSVIQAAFIKHQHEVRRYYLKEEISADFKPGFVKVNFQKALDSSAQATQFLDFMTQFGNNVGLSGSLAISAQQNIFRPQNNQIHDLDFRIRNKEVLLQVISALKDSYPNSALSVIFSSKKTQSDVVTFALDKDNPNTLTVDLFTKLDGEEYDFPTKSIEYRGVNGETRSISLVDSADIFDKKLAMGRAKDVQDAILTGKFNPLFSKEDGTVPKTDTPPEVQELPGGRVALRTNFKSPPSITADQEAQRADLFSRTVRADLSGALPRSQILQIDRILGYADNTRPNPEKFALVEEMLAPAEKKIAEDPNRAKAAQVTDEQLSEARSKRVSISAYTREQKEMQNWRQNVEARKPAPAPTEKFDVDAIVNPKPVKETGTSPATRTQDVAFNPKEVDPQRRLGIKPTAEEKARRPKINEYIAKANRIINQLYSPSQAQDRINELEAILRSYGKGRLSDVKRSDSEYIFTQFAQAGALSDNEADELRRSDDRTQAQTNLKKAIDELKSRDLRDRAEAAQINIGFIAADLAALRQEMADAGITEAEINRAIGDKEVGVLAMAEVFDVKNGQAILSSLERGMQQAGFDAASIRFAVETRDIELSRLNEVAAQLVDLGVPEEQVQQTMAGVREARDLAEPTVTQTDLFGDQSVAAAQIVDAALKGTDEVKNPRSFATLLTEAKYAKVGTLDILNELRLRNINIKSNIEDAIMRPGVMYPLEYWLKKPSNQGRDPFILRQEWLISVDSGLRDVADFPAAKAAILNDMSEAERMIYDDWKQSLDKLRTRLKTGKDFSFGSIETAFPNALFNRFTLSQMRDTSKLSEEDLVMLRYLTSDTDKSLADVWFDDLHFAWDARRDLHDQIEDILSESEMKEFMRWRKARVRSEVPADIEEVRSRAVRAVLSMRQSNSMMDAETYAKFIGDATEKIAAANENEIRAIVQNAFELLEARRAGDSDATLDSITEQDMSSEDSATAETEDDFSFDQDTEVTEDEEATEESVGDLSLFTSDTMPIPGSKVQVDPEVGDANADPAKIYAQMRLRGVRNMQGPISGVVTNATITDHLHEITMDWKGAPSFTVFENLGQLTEEEEQYIKSKAGGQTVKGVMMPDGRVYLFSEALESVEDAEFTFFHEIYGHRGLRGFLGDKLNAFLENQYRLNKNVREQADALMAEARETKRGMTTIEATEEVLADMAAQNEEPGLFSQIIRAIQKFLRSIKMNSVADWMESKSQAELASILSDVRKAVRNGELSPLHGAPADVRFNAEPIPIEVYATNETGRTSAYAVYNPFTHNWTVFYNKDGLDAKNFGIEVFDNYGEALKKVKQFGKTIRVKDNPTRQTKTPGQFIAKPTPKFWDVKGIKKWARMAQITIFNKYKPVYDVVNYLRGQGVEVDLDRTLKLYSGRIKPHFDWFNLNVVKPISASLNSIKAKNFSYTFRDDNGQPMEYKDSDLVGLYLTALHAKERNAEVKARTMQDGKPTNEKGSGMFDSEARDIIKDLQASPIIQELQEISAITQRLAKRKVNYALGTGLINEFAARNMKNKYDFYVNLSGNKDEGSIEFIDKAALGGRGFNVAGQDFKYSTGRSTMATDVLENTLNGYLSVIVRGQKNNVMRSVLRMVNNAGDPNLAVVNPIFSARQLDIDKLIEDKVFYAALSQAGKVDEGRELLRQYRDSINSKAMTPFEAASAIQKELDLAMYQGRITSKQHEALSKRLESVIEKNLQLGADGYVKEVSQAATHKDEGALLVKVEGKPVIIKFNEGEDGGEKFGTFVSSLKNIGSQDQVLVLEKIAEANRFIGQLLTSKNLTWVPINWFRDMGTAYANAASDPRVGEKLARKIAGYSPRAYRVAINKLMQQEYIDKNGPVYRMFKKVFKTDLTTREDGYWTEYVNSGAPVFFMDRKDIKEQIEDMQREMNPRGGIKGTWDAYGKFADFVGIPSEMSVRFSAYMHLREAGWTRDEAAVYAKELTVNFEQSGSSRWIRALFMFANPAIQGNVRMLRDAVVNGKLNPQFFKVATALAGLGAVANFIARAASAEDDEEPDDLDTVARYKRATQVVLFPGMPMGAPIFLPYGWNVYYAVGQFLPDSMFFGTPAKTTAERIATTAIDAFWPLGQSESAGIYGTFIKSITPTPLAPIVDLSMNESRYGGPITKENNPFVKAEESASWSNFSTASPVSTYMMRKLNQITGGSQYKSGFIDFNPDRVDYLFGAYLPGPISDTGRAINTLINLGMGKDLKSTKLPLIDRFGSKGRDENPGWDAGAYRRAQTYIQTLYKDAQTEQGERKQEILKEHPKVGNAKAALDAIDKNIRNMRTALRAIESDTNRSMQEKVEARNQVQKLEARYFADAVRIAMKTGFKDPVLSD